MARLPAERYVLFLATHPDGLAIDQVNERLEDMHLDAAEETYVDQLRRKHPAPSPFQPKNRRNRASQQYILGLGIKTLYFADNTTKAAIEILEQPRVREVVEAAAIADLPSALISKTVHNLLGIAVPAATIDRYLGLFFDVSVLDRMELRAYLDLRAARCIGEKKGRKAPPIQLDIRRLAAAAPSPTEALRLIGAAFGRLKANVDLKTTLTQLRNMALAQAQVAMSGAVPDGVRKAQQYVEVAQRAETFAKDMVSPAEELQRHMANLQLVTPDRRVITVDELDGELLAPQVVSQRQPPDVAAALGDDGDGEQEQAR